MKRIFNILVGFLALIGLLAVGLNVVGPENVFSPGCTTITLRETQSPDGQFVASIVSEACEEPLDSGVHVHMRQVGEKDFSSIRIADNSSTEFEMT